LLSSNKGKPDCCSMLLCSIMHQPQNHNIYILHVEDCSTLQNVISMIYTQSPANNDWSL